ncbi:hypothetical protein AZK08_01165, partial [Streptococcus pneumoniae]
PFSILPQYPLKKDGREIPLHFDQDASLSALLLDEDYYNILVHEKEIIQGYSVLSNCGLYSSKIKFKPRQLHLAVLKYSLRLAS